MNVEDSNVFRPWHSPGTWGHMSTRAQDLAFKDHVGMLEHIPDDLVGIGDLCVLCVLLRTSLFTSASLQRPVSSLKSQETCMRLPVSLRESLPFITWAPDSRLGQRAGNEEGSRSPSQWLAQVYRTQWKSWSSRYPSPPYTTCGSRWPSYLQNHFVGGFSELSRNISLLF